MSALYNLRNYTCPDCDGYGMVNLLHPLYGSFACPYDSDEAPCPNRHCMNGVVALDRHEAFGHGMTGGEPLGCDPLAIMAATRRLRGIRSMRRDYNTARMTAAQPVTLPGESA